MNSGFGGGTSSRRGQAQRERMLVVGGGTFVLSLLIVIGLLVYNQSQVEAKPELKDGKAQLSDVFGTVALVAPTAPVPQGAKLTSVALKELYWPRSEVPEGAVRDMEGVKEMYAKVGIPANQPILRSNLSATPIVGGVAELIPPGYRAVTIEVDATAGVEGWATPGAHVDVQVTYRDPEDNVDKTRVAVEDAVVLSYNGKTEKIKDREEGEISRVSPSSTVTLAVTADDSLKLRTAGAIGRISLALRNSNDPRGVGAGIFAADEWDKSNKKKDGSKFVSKGFAQIKDESGSVKEFQLGPDQKWWESNDTEG